MARWIRRVLLVIAILGLAVVVIGPWLLYELGLANVIGRPSLPNSVPVPIAEAQGVWRKLREDGPIEIEPLNPYGYVLELVSSDGARSGSKVAWFVARNHNGSNLHNRRMIWWHLSGAALTIWLTRHWSRDQLIAKAHELLPSVQAPSNNALLSDTSTSPLRAQHGAAKRER
jgi:hypothetical protein